MSVFATVGFSVFCDRGYIVMYICPVNVSPLFLSQSLEQGSGGNHSQKTVT